MEQKIMYWQGIAIAIVTALTTVAIVAVQGFIRFQKEYNRFKLILRERGESEALKATRISRSDAKKRGLTK